MKVWKYPWIANIFSSLELRPLWGWYRHITGVPLDGSLPGMSGHSPSDEVTLKQAKRILFDIDPGWAFAYMFTKQPVRFLFHKLEPDKDINQGYMLVFGIGIAMLVHTNQKHIFYKAFKSEAEIYNNES